MTSYSAECACREDSTLVFVAVDVVDSLPQASFFQRLIRSGALSTADIAGPSEALKFQGCELHEQRSRPVGHK